MAVISVSRRTDIPAFYTDWFFNRIKKGYVLVPSPFNANRALAVPLDKSYVDCFVFWTKNAQPLLERIDELNGYTYYFQYTVNRYGPDIESDVPSSATETFINLSEKVGKEKVIWRYDPILISERYSLDWHIQNYEELARLFSGKTDKCVISFVDMEYRGAKTSGATLGFRAPSESEMEYLAEKISIIAGKYGITVSSCCESIDLSVYGIGHNSCIDRNLIEMISGKHIETRLDNLRKDCGCIKSIDIGMYNTCRNGCKYCYATSKGSHSKSIGCNEGCDWLNPNYTDVQTLYFEGKEIIDFELWKKNRSDVRAYKPKAKPKQKIETRIQTLTIDDFFS